MTTLHEAALQADVNAMDGRLTRLPSPCRGMETTAPGGRVLTQHLPQCALEAVNGTAPHMPR